MQNLTELCCEILQLSDDGENLAPKHLWFIQTAINNNMDNAITVLTEIRDELLKGEYQKPWLYGVEHLTQDHENYVYWKGAHVEHYTFDKYDEGRESALELSSRCQLLELNNIKVTCGNAVWLWGNHAFQKIQA